MFFLNNIRPAVRWVEFVKFVQGQITIIMSDQVVLLFISKEPWQLKNNLQLDCEQIVPDARVFGSPGIIHL
jgi:hypothetical protein